MRFSRAGDVYKTDSDKVKLEGKQLTLKSLI